MCSNGWVTKISKTQNEHSKVRSKGAIHRGTKGRFDAHQCKHTVEKPLKDHCSCKEVPLNGLRRLYA